MTAVRTSDVERRHLGGFLSSGIWMIGSEEFSFFTSLDTSCKDVLINAVS